MNPAKDEPATHPIDTGPERTWSLRLFVGGPMVPIDRVVNAAARTAQAGETVRDLALRAARAAEALEKAHAEHRQTLADLGRAVELAAIEAQELDRLVRR